MTQPSTQTTPQPSGWHPADIVAALRKAGWSLRRLSVHYGYHPKVLAAPLSRRWPKGERLIAETLGVKPQDIWPDRYDADGQPNGRHGKRTSRLS